MWEYIFDILGTHYWWVMKASNKLLRNLKHISCTISIVGINVHTSSLISKKHSWDSSEGRKKFKWRTWLVYQFFGFSKETTKKRSMLNFYQFISNKTVEITRAYLFNWWTIWLFTFHSRPKNHNNQLNQQNRSFEHQ